MNKKIQTLAWHEVVIPILLLLAMLSPYAGLSNSTYHGSAGVHVVLEFACMLFALLSALALISRFWVLGNRLHLLMGMAFLVNALSDGLHSLLVLLLMLNGELFSGLEVAALVGTYWVGRFLPGVFLLFAPWLDAYMGVSAAPWRETLRTATGFVLLTLVASSLMLVLPFEHYVYIDHWLPRPIDFIAGCLLLGVFWVFMRCYRQQADALLWWMALSLIMQAAAQFLMAFSQTLYDAPFMFSHLYRLLAYAVPLWGFSLYQSNNLAERLHAEQALWHKEQELRHLNTQLELVVARRTEALVLEVTRHTTARERLHDKEERLRLAMEVAEIGTWHWQARDNQDIRDANLNRILGEAHEETTQSHEDFLRRIPDEDRQAVLQQRQTAIRQHEDYFQEHRLLRTDGTLLWVRNCGRCFYDRQGKPTHIIGALFDITKRKQAEQQLQQHQQLLEAEVSQRTAELRKMHEKFRQLFFNSKAVELIIDPSTAHIVEANLAAEQYYGYSLSQLKLMKISDINTLNPDEIKAEMQRAKDQKRNHFFFRHRLANGEIRDVEVHSGPILLDESHLLYSIIHDITERKQAENQLRRSEARFRLLAEYASDMISRHDPSGNYTYVSPSCYNLLGYKEVELLGYPAYKFFHPEDVTAINQAHQQQLQASVPTTNSISYRMRCKDGHYIWFETTTRTVHDEVSSCLKEIIAISRDISERKRQERVLQQAKDQAEAANRAKSAFLANMSHELRTPLNAILGYAQVLLRDPHLSESQRNSIRVMRSSGDYLLTLINDILDLSKIEAERLELQPSLFNLPSFIHSNVEVFLTRAQQKGIQLKTSIAANLPQWVRGDERRLRQIMLNLLSNAVKFTPKSGNVLLQVEKVDEQIRFKIRDSGIGIAKHKQARIFLPFEQIEQPQHHAEGTGLGLSITAKLVELMQGRIEVDSQLGRGSEFRVYLPLPEEEQAPPSSATVRENRAILRYQGTPKHLLIVDDAWENRLFLRQLLEDVGFSVAEADSGTAALACVQQLLPDLVLMDLVMPDMNGLQASHLLHQQGGLEKVPIIAVSASAFEHHQEQSLAAGCVAFLCKPINVQQLFATIAQCLHLEWIYADDTQTPVATSWDIAGPTAQQAALLHELALRGNMQGIIEYVEQLAEDNPALGNFSKQAKQLADELDEDRLCDMAKHYLADSN